MQQAAKVIAEWRKSVGKFAFDNFGFEPDPWQSDVFGAWDRGDQRIAMQACKGPGKTALLAILIWHFLATRLHPKVAATSISGDNLSDGLWTELSKWQGRSEFLKEAFEWQATRIVARDHPETWWGSARSWSRTANAEQQGAVLAGLHADYILFVLDEAGGMPVAILNAAEAALASGIECRILMAGNPIEAGGALGRACLRDRHLWTVVTITGDPDNPKRSTRIDIEWARAQILQYGRDNPWVMANVFGEFPPSSPLIFIPTDIVEAAAKREPECLITDPMILGVEVARFGDDESGVCLRKGRDARTFPWYCWRNLDTMQIAARVSQIRSDHRADGTFIDGGGVGGGVVDRCRQLRMEVIDVQFGGKADRISPTGETAVYANKSAEMWGNMRDWLKTGAIPDDPILKAQLTSRRYAYVQRDGRDAITLEPKDDLKKRGFASPDRADMLALTFAYPVERNWNSGGAPGDQRGASLVQSDYNPFAMEQ